MTETDRKDGRVVGIAGPVIDVEFQPGSLPELNSALEFTISVDGKTVNLDAVAYEKGGVTTPLEERPAIRYREKVATGLADAQSPAAAAPPPN